MRNRSRGPIEVEKCLDSQPLLDTLWKRDDAVDKNAASLKFWQEQVRLVAPSCISTQEVYTHELCGSFAACSEITGIFRDRHWTFQHDGRLLTARMRRIHGWTTTYLSTSHRNQTGIRQLNAPI